MSDKAKENQQADMQSERRTINENFGAVRDMQMRRLEDVVPRMDEERQWLTDQYRSTAPLSYEDMYGPSPIGSRSSVGGGGGGGTFSVPKTSDYFGDANSVFQKLGSSGGVNMGKLNATIGELKAFADNGGLSPEEESRIRENIGYLTELGRTGGFDPGSTDRMRGLGTFEEFQETGGVSPEERELIRARGMGNVRAISDQLRQHQQRMANVAGGYVPGSAVADRQMGRDAYRAAAEEQRATELGLMDQIRQGRMWGTEGLTSSEQELQRQLISNRLQGAGAAAGAGTALEGLITQNQLAALRERAAVNQASQALRQQGMIAGGQGMYQIGQYRTSRDLQEAAQRQAAANASASRAAAASRANAADAARTRAEYANLAQFNAGQDRWAAEQARYLYGDVPADEMWRMQQLQQIEADRAAAANVSFGGSSYRAAVPGGWTEGFGNVMGGIGDIAGGVGGFFG